MAPFKLLVKSVSVGTTKKDILNLFQRYDVHNAVIPHGQPDRAIVTFKTEEDAEIALQDSYGLYIRGQPVEVTRYVKPKKPNRRGRGGQGRSGVVYVEQEPQPELAQTGGVAPFAIQTDAYSTEFPELPMTFTEALRQQRQPPYTTTMAPPMPIPTVPICSNAAITTIHEHASGAQGREHAQPAEEPANSSDSFFLENLGQVETLPHLPSVTGSSPVPLDLPEYESVRQHHFKICILCQKLEKRRAVSNPCR